MNDFRYFSELYLLLLKAANKGNTRMQGFESVRYNADAGFTLQHHVILAAVSPNDQRELAEAKMKVVADFLDIWINLRFWNYTRSTYSFVQYAVFTIIRDIRHKPLEEIRRILHARITSDMDSANFDKAVRLNNFTSKAIHRQLARFTDWLEQQSGEPGMYENYTVRSGSNAFEIEHIWSNHPERFREEFPQSEDFESHRNQIGGLLLLPKKINASLNDKSYDEKLPVYKGQNKLAKSLSKDFKQNNPGFQQIINKFGLPEDWSADKCNREKELIEFTKDDLINRSNLYCKIAGIIWSPSRLLAEVDE